MILLSFKYIFLIIEMWNHEKKNLPTYYDFCTVKKQKDRKNSYVWYFTGHL